MDGVTDSRDDLSQCGCDACDEDKTSNSVQACSDLHVAHVLVGVRHVTVVIVHIGLEGVLVVIHFCVAILFVICCIERRTLYTNGCERYVLLVSMCASETDTCTMDVVSEACTSCARAWISAMRVSPCSPLSCRACVFFSNKDPLHARWVRCTAPPRTPPGAAVRKNKTGQWRHLPTAIAAVPGTEKAKKI